MTGADETATAEQVATQPLSDAWVTVDEAAQLLCCTTRTVMRMIERDQLESMRTEHRTPTGSKQPGRLRWISRASVEAVIDRTGPAVAEDRDRNSKYYVSLRKRV